MKKILLIAIAILMGQVAPVLSKTAADCLKLPNYSSAQISCLQGCAGSDASCAAALNTMQNVWNN